MSAPREAIPHDQLATRLEALQSGALQLRSDTQSLLDDHLLPAAVAPNVVQSGRTLKATAEHLSAALLVLDSIKRPPRRVQRGDPPIW